MQFGSVPFLFVFLPIFLVAYYICPARLRNFCLLLGSVVFYGVGISWRILPLLILLGITLVTYFIGLCLPERPYFYWFALVGLALLLVFFKCYADGSQLPAAMSFYLFQVAAYLGAVYRGKMKPECSLLNYTTGIWMFPKLLSGPLMEPGALRLQLRRRKLSLKDFRDGLQLLILGLAMKVILANRVGGLWSQAGVVGYVFISTPFAWLSILSFSMKLYFDFWGYSLMAMGLGRMLGFQLPENFHDPYWARSISEFYRRWHMSLGLWFRENVYIPMGGNRKGLGRTIVNLLVVWALTGLWHGIGGNYLIWAGILVFFIILERLFLGKLLDKSYVLCHVYTVLIAVLSWVPFAIGDFGDLTMFFGRLFGFLGTVTDPTDYVHFASTYGPLLGTGLVLMTPLPRFLWKKLGDTWLADVLCFALFWVSVYFITTAAQDPFMYGQY